MCFVFGLIFSYYLHIAYYLPHEVLKNLSIQHNMGYNINIQSYIHINNINIFFPLQNKPHLLSGISMGSSKYVSEVQQIAE